MGYTERDMQLFEIMRKLDADCAELSNISVLVFSLGNGLIQTKMNTDVSQLHNFRMQLTSSK